MLHNSFHPQVNSKQGTSLFSKKKLLTVRAPQFRRPSLMLLSPFSFHSSLGIIIEKEDLTYHLINYNSSIFILSYTYTNFRTIFS